MDLYPGQGPQRPEVDLLPQVRVRVVRPRLHPSREVVDRLHLVAGKQAVEEGLEVQPPELGPPKRAVEQVETVDVDVGAHQQTLGIAR